MKHVWQSVWQASVAAGAVFIPSAVSAETKPVEFETEFDLDLAVGAAALPAPAVPKLAGFDLPSAAAKWQESIGSYLDGLLGAPTPPPAMEPAPVPDDDEDIDALIAAEVAAFAPAAVAAPAPQISLAPVLSHAMDCSLCRGVGEWVEVTNVVDLAAPAEGMVDDAAAWERMAEWASARLAADASDDEADDGFDLFFDEPDLAD